MEASERTISQILTEQIRYEIPPYQRPYSWEKGLEKTRDALYEVVDGQQRLTTLNLIFARLRDHIRDVDAKGELAKRVLPRNPLTGEEKTPRLTLRLKDQSFFRRHVLVAEPVMEEIRKDLEQKEDAPKLRIVENLEAIDAFCEDKDEQTLKLFANFLLSRVYVVFVTTNSWHSAYRLFNVLNARGMALSNADLIKNALFARLGGGGDRSEELEERWLELEDTIGIERMDQFLSHHRTSIVALKARGALHEEFEPLVKASPDPFAFLDAVTASAKNYMRIQDSAFDDASAIRALRSLHRVAFEEWVPPLLAFLNRPAEGMTAGEFIVLLEKITYQNWIRRLAFTARLTVYFQLINAIKAGRSAGEITAIFRANAQDAEFETLLDGEVYNKPFAQAVLLRLEEADQDDSVTKSYGGQITIEQVLPQALKDDYWKDRFTDEEHRLWLHRLGNLALLAGIKNYKAQYFSFDRKKGLYAEKNKKVSFDTTKQILSEPEWRSEQIEARQRALMESAVRIWSIG